MVEVPLLRSETLRDVSSRDQAERVNLLNQLRQLPPEAFTRLQYLQPQIGCFQRCAFCSQIAGRDVWQLARDGLRNIIAALAAVGREHKVDSTSATLGAGRHQHRPGVLFPYMDNDIGSYPYLDDYIRWVTDEFECKVRLATVGFSSGNEQLVQMHARVARDLASSLAGVRFSWTPYTLGWTEHGKSNDLTSRKQFISDFGAMLRTYRPAVQTLGADKETGVCVELRFAPHVVTDVGELAETRVADHHVIAIGPHLLVAEQPGGESVPETRLLGVVDGMPVFSTEGLPYRLVTADTFADSDPAKLAHRMLADPPPTIVAGQRRVRLFRFCNADGPYYATDPTFLSTGEFRALHFYPRSLTRSAGYTDATRYLLNALIAVKTRFGMDRRDEWPEATRQHIDSVLGELCTQASKLRQFDASAAEHVRDEIIPLVEGYTKALHIGGYEPRWFFHPRFSIDTGQIVNQGRAKGLFRGLVSTIDEPMTPREERGYGRASISADRGMVWRLAPMPHGVPAQSRARRGGKNNAASSGLLQVQELDPRHLRPVHRATRSPLREFYLELNGASVEHVDLEQGRATLAYPGRMLPIVVR